jgi:hypothetical protein
MQAAVAALLLVHQERAQQAGRVVVVQAALT